MAGLTTLLDRRTEMFAANAAAMRALVADPREKVAALREGGGEPARRRTSKVNGPRRQGL